MLQDQSFADVTSFPVIKLLLLAAALYDSTTMRVECCQSTRAQVFDCDLVRLDDALRDFAWVSTMHMRPERVLSSGCCRAAARHPRQL